MLSRGSSRLDIIINKKYRQAKFTHLSFYDFRVRLDKSGNFQYIAYNNPVRDFINAPAQQIHQIYQAYYNLASMVKDPSYQFQYKMAAGEVLVFNNRRVLHGRMGFNPANASRLLHGIYLDWDNIKSTWRVLNKHMNAAAVKTR